MNVINKTSLEFFVCQQINKSKMAMHDRIRKIVG